MNHSLLARRTSCPCCVRGGKSPSKECQVIAYLFLWQNTAMHLNSMFFKSYNPPQTNNNKPLILSVSKTMEFIYCRTIFRNRWTVSIKGELWVYSPWEWGIIIQHKHTQKTCTRSLTNEQYTESLLQKLKWPATAECTHYDSCVFYFRLP